MACVAPPIVFIANVWSACLAFGYLSVSCVNYQISFCGVPPFKIVFMARPRGRVACQARCYGADCLCKSALLYALPTSSKLWIASPFSYFFTSYVTFYVIVHGARFFSGCTSLLISLSLLLLAFVIVCIIAEPAGKARQRSSIAKEIW